MFNYLHLKVYENRFDLINLKTNKLISKISLEKFLTKRFLIAKISTALELLNKIIRELLIKIDFYSKIQLFIQNKVDYEDGLSEPEARALFDMSKMLGCIGAYLYPNSNHITNDEALSELKLFINNN